MKHTLKPVVHRDEYTRLIEREILAYLEEAIFQPLLDTLSAPILDLRENEEGKRNDLLRAAILAGVLAYADGVFSGKFNAALSRELRRIGAKAHPEDGTFHLEQGFIPFSLRSAIVTSMLENEGRHREILGILDLMEENLPKADTGIKMVKEIDTIHQDLQKQLDKSVAAEEIVVPEMVGAVEGMQETLSRGVDLDIKGFTSQAIADIRAKVQANLAAGGRTDRLARLIETEYGVAKRKAAFIAENETSLAISKFREARYTSIGATEYVWATSLDERVRTDHQKLEGRTFSWSSPPVVDSASGRRGHPGEDYNCRCVAVPIVNVK